MWQHALNLLFFSEESWDLHVRQKRLIDNTPGGNRRVNIQQVPYVVNIRDNGYRNCAGSILTPYIILTAAHCVEEHESNYSILSGSAYANNGTFHHVTRIIRHPGYHPRRFADDLALLIISPPIDIIRSVNRNILLYSGPLLLNSLGTVSAWGCNAITE